MNNPMLECNELTIKVAGRVLVENLNLALAAGEFVAVLGCNGTGKTLSLLTLAGLRAADAGSVKLGGEDIAALPRQAVARQLALLPQDSDDMFPATVLEVTLQGRQPHIARWGWETAQDLAIARNALAQTGMAALAERDVLSLSGGERRRLAIAQTLAQAPRIYLLDEPTNHLDPQHQLDSLHLFRRAASGGATVLASLHDVNLAARFADRCLLLLGDGRWQLGSADAVLTPSTLEALYATPMEAVPWRDRQLFIAAVRNDRRSDRNGGTGIETSGGTPIN